MRRLANNYAQILEGGPKIPLPDAKHKKLFKPSESEIHSPIVSNIHVKATLPSTAFNFTDALLLPLLSMNTSPSPLAIHALLIPISFVGT